MLRIFTAVCLISAALAFDDIEKKCNPGERIVSIKRAAQGNKPERISVECGPMTPSADAVKDPKCEEGKPLACNGKPEGCPSGSWLGGVNLYQLDSKNNADLIVPICCTSDNVAVDNCGESRLNSAKSPIDSSVNSKTVYQSLTCWALVDSQAKPASLVDFIFKAGTCDYKVSGAGGGGGSAPKPTDAAPPPPVDATPAPQATTNAAPPKTTDAGQTAAPPKQTQAPPKGAKSGENQQATTKTPGKSDKKSYTLPTRKLRPP